MSLALSTPSTSPYTQENLQEHLLPGQKSYVLIKAALILCDLQGPPGSTSGSIWHTVSGHFEIKHELQTLISLKASRELLLVERKGESKSPKGIRSICDY